MEPSPPRKPALSHAKRMGEVADANARDSCGFAKADIGRW